MDKYIELRLVAAGIFLFPFLALAEVQNGDFSSGLAGWSTTGSVAAVNNEAQLLDSGGDCVLCARLFQGVELSPGGYTLEFDFFSSLSSVVPDFTFPDSFFASLYFANDLQSLDLDRLSFDQTTSLFDQDYARMLLKNGTITESTKGEGWYHFAFTFQNIYQNIIPVFELFGLNEEPEDSFVLIDDVSLKSTCQGTCDAENPELDEDGDGVSNCDELEDGTEPCDSGSFLVRLKPTSCAGANGFLNQVNIATVLNHLAAALHVKMEYRDWFGVLQGTVEFDLEANLKRDVPVNELGLKADSYGTLCVTTDAEGDGAWSGGLTIYKPKYYPGVAAILLPEQEFDFTLYYPFINPQTGSTVLPLNTNSLGTDGLGTVANWVRLTDAVNGDGRGLWGTLYYYDAAGKFLGKHEVRTVDGGRYDYPAHEVLGVNAVGLVEFVPAGEADSYYLEASRYFYDGVGASSDSFYTAFTLPERPLTGALINGKVSTLADELSIVEMFNGADQAAMALLQLYDAGGSKSGEDSFFMVPKASIHRIMSGAVLPAGEVCSAELSGTAQSLSAYTLIYHFDDQGRLAYAYAAPFVESGRTVQLTEYNTFISHANKLYAHNSSKKALVAAVNVIDYSSNHVAEFQLSLEPKSSELVQVPLPANSYGTVIVDSGADRGLVIQNNVVRQNQYEVTFQGK